MSLFATANVTYAYAFDGVCPAFNPGFGINVTLHRIVIMTFNFFGSIDVCF